MRDDFEEEDDRDELSELLDRFEKMMEEQVEYFFDAEDFEDIIDYYLEQHDSPRAQAAIEAAQHQYPYNSIFELKKAQLLASTNQEEKALKILSRLERIFPNNFEIHYTRSFIYSKLSQHKLAIKELKKALKLTDNPYEILVTLAFEHEKIWEYEEAIRQLEKALEYDSTEETIINELASFYDMAENLDKGVSYFQKFVEKNPYNVPGWFNLGILYNKLSLYEKSIEAFDFAIAIDPEYSPAYFNKGNAYASASMYEKAIETYRESLQHEAPDANAYCCIGECYQKLQNYDDALFYFKLATKLDTETYYAWYGIACIHYLQGNLKPALVYVQKALHYFEEFERIKYLEGDIFMALGKYDKAIDTYNRVAANIPKNQDIWFDLASAFDAINDSASAISVLKEGCSYHHNENIDLLYYCIEYIIEHDSVAHALPYIKIAYPLQPSIIEILFMKFPMLKNNKEYLSFLNSLFDKGDNSISEKDDSSPSIN